MASAINDAANAIREAEALLITAGAGMGVDSGLPDFRGKEGFWRAYPPFAKLGLGFEELANPRWFDRDPPLAWGFYGHRLELYRRTKPHDGFLIMQQWVERKPAGCFVYTSNVDGHFQKSGYPRDCVVECHGSIHHLQCTEDCRGQVWSAGKVTGLAIDPDTCRARGDLPHCPDCGALARPNVLMFGDGRWQARRTEVQQGRFDDWLAQVGSRRLVVIELGAGTSIPSVRRIGESLLTQGAKLVRINPREAQGPRGTISIESGALAAVKGIAAVMA